MATTYSASSQDQRIVWAFWIACGLTVVAGVAPLLLGGGSSRINAVVFPFAVGAVALAACALLHARGKVIVSLLYVLAGLAIAYGILAALSTPLRLAVIGTCSPEPASCLSGMELPLTGGESTALGVVIGFGVVAMLVGYFGLFTLYRRRPILAPSPSTPPVRRIAPVATSSRETAPPTPAPAMVSSEARPTTSKPEAEPAPEPQLELAAPEPQLELPAPTSEETIETPSAVATPTPERKPRRRRAPKVRPESATEQNGGL
ncbi:MAG TPA: LPXTG cell wall anchor domain-containing protein [Candidatus Dormibacteraeota bacterium]|nr:LPXTG cell wall anchor domain-containing protein [Candidatus Dormibacteraeota bacterium]